MEHVRAFSIDPELLRKIQDFIRSDKNAAPLETSELYSSTTQSKVLDPSLRRSKFRLWKDPVLFEMMDSIVETALHRHDKAKTSGGSGGSNDQDYKFLLVKNDITEIRYQEGDFFERHSGYLSLTSNCLEEFTLVLCVTPPDSCEKCDGGDTLIFPYHAPQPIRYDTKTPGHGVIFRKDMDHAGEKIIKGEKHILTANLWATRANRSSKVLHVTFPTADDGKYTAKKSNQQCLAELADQNKSYALPVDCLKGTMLGDFVECADLEKASGAVTVIGESLV